MEGLMFWCAVGLFIGFMIRLCLIKRKRISPCMAQWPPEVVERLKRESNEELKKMDIKRYNQLYMSHWPVETMGREEFEKIFPHPRAGYGKIAFEDAWRGLDPGSKDGDRIAFRPILPDKPVSEFVGVDPACSDNDYSPMIITGYQDEKGVYHITSVENHSSMTIEEIVQRYGPLNSVVDIPIKVHPILERSIMMSELREAARRAQETINNRSLYGVIDDPEYREELNLKMLACMFRISKDGNSPYAIGRVS